MSHTEHCIGIFMCNFKCLNVPLILMQVLSTYFVHCVSCDLVAHNCSQTGVRHASHSCCNIIKSCLYILFPLLKRL